MNRTRKLTKSRSKQLFGVAGGIAEYFNVDPVIIRIAFVIGFFTPLPALIAYIVLGLIMPEPDAEDVIDVTPPSGGDASYADREGSAESAKPKEKKPFVRSRTDKWVAGVCGGIAAYFNVDPILIRGLFLVAILGYGTGLIVYLVLAIIMPQE